MVFLFCFRWQLGGKKVFKAILNDERKYYLEYHRDVFKVKEELRKKLSTLIDDSSDEELL